MEDIERIPYRDDLPKAIFDVLSLRATRSLLVKPKCLSPLLALPDLHSVGELEL
jgi:hypothetical protein